MRGRKSLGLTPSGFATRTPTGTTPTSLLSGSAPKRSRSRTLPNQMKNHLTTYSRTPMKKIEVDISNTSKEYWEKILTQEGYDISRGSIQGDPQQKFAVITYLENMNMSVVNEEDVKSGFQIEVLKPEIE